MRNLQAGECEVRETRDAPESEVRIVDENPGQAMLPPTKEQIVLRRLEGIERVLRAVCARVDVPCDVYVHPLPPQRPQQNRTLLRAVGPASPASSAASDARMDRLESALLRLAGLLSPAAPAAPATAPVAPGVPTWEPVPIGWKPGDLIPPRADAPPAAPPAPARVVEGEIDLTKPAYWDSLRGALGPWPPAPLQAAYDAQQALKALAAAGGGEKP